MQHRDWSVVVQGLGRKRHDNVTPGLDPLFGEDFVAFTNDAGDVVARYQKPFILGMAVEPPGEDQAQR